MKALLALADGTVFEGESFGAAGEASGEVVFNTSMTGYQEILTDPSYRGQLVAMTYPEIGNVGVNAGGRRILEAVRPRLHREGVLGTSEQLARPAEPRSVPARARHSRHPGYRHARPGASHPHARRAGWRDLDASIWIRASLVAKARAVPGLIGRDLVKEVTCAAPYEWD